MWREKTGKNKPDKNSADKEERKMYRIFRDIKNNVWIPYNRLNTEIEKIKYFLKYPNAEEIIVLLDEISKNEVSADVIRIRRVKEWVDKSGTEKIRGLNSGEKEEFYMWNTLTEMRRRLVKTYMGLTDKQEILRFRAKYPYIDEILNIISQIDLKYGTEENKKLARLVQESLMKKRQLQEAKKLEVQYQDVCKKSDLGDSHEDK